MHLKATELQRCSYCDKQYKKDKEHDCEERDVSIILEDYFDFENEKSERRERLYKNMDWVGEKKNLKEAVQIFMDNPEMIKFNWRDLHIAANPVLMNKYHEDSKAGASIRKFVFWKVDGDGLKRKVGFLKKSKEFITGLPYIDTISNVKNVSGFGKKTTIDKEDQYQAPKVVTLGSKTLFSYKPVKTVQPRLLRTHILGIFLTCAISLVTSFITLSVVQLAPFDINLFFYIALPLILLPGSLYGILYCLSYVDRYEIVYGWGERKKSAKTWLLVALLIGVLSPIGTIFGGINLFFGLWFWEGITFFSFAEKHYNQNDEPIRFYSGIRHLLKNIFDVRIVWRRVIEFSKDKKKKFSLSNIIKGVIALIIFSVLLYLFFILLPRLPIFSPWGFVQVSLPSLLSDTWEILYPSIPTIGKQLQFMTAFALGCGAFFFLWNPKRAMKMTKIFLIYIVIVVIGFPGIVDLIYDSEGGALSIGAILFGLFQMFYLIMNNMDVICSTFVINANSSQLKKSWLQFNFLLKNKEYYVVVLFFMLMSGIGGYFCFNMLDGTKLPIPEFTVPFINLEWSDLVNNYQYVARNVVFVVCMVYMWGFYRQGLRTFRFFPRKDPSISLFEKIDVYTPPFLTYERIE